MNELPLVFPFLQYWWFYLVFVAFVLVLLALDLGVFHRSAHAVSFKEAGFWTVVWISLGLTFNYALYHYVSWKLPLDPRFTDLRAVEQAEIASRIALEFLTGFVIEKALAVDNIFVFVVVFASFGIPAKYQHRVLFYGIMGALVFRATFIALGSILLQYHIVMVLFGVLLLITGVKMFFSGVEAVHPEESRIIRLLQRVLPVTPKLHGQRFVVKEEARWVATPLLLSLAAIEVSDIVFAIDSVPAIFAITREPLIVFTSNVFAILGLRAMYFLLANVVSKFRFLKYGLGVVLIFVGLKMVWLNDAFGGKFPIEWSLGFITVVVLSSIGLSLLIPPPPQPESPATPQ